MISDSITNASATASSNARDTAKKKKKKNNKSCKMKQNKLGLSQVAVTNKEERRRRREKPDDRVNNPAVNLDMLGREECDNSNGGNQHHESCFMESPSSSSSMGGTDILTNFSERSRSRSSSSSSSSDNITEKDNADDDDGCVDDWEAFADALEEKEEREREKEKLLHESVKDQENVVVGVGDAASRKQRSDRAWRREDGHRPQGLPDLGKQLSFPELDKRFTTASCPICYEDLDVTDSRFFPCPCGFRLCLFCHKTIYDGDGRCPGCRKPYERDAITTETSFEDGCVTVRLTRSSSMFCRS